MFRPDFPHLLSISFLLVALCVFTACTPGRLATSGPVSPKISHGSQLVDINSADAAALEKLPGVGSGLAKKIVEHRTRYGPFRRAEHLMVIDGISDRRFRKIRHLITAD